MCCLIEIDRIDKVRGEARYIFPVRKTELKKLRGKHGDQSFFDRYIIFGIQRGFG